MNERERREGVGGRHFGCGFEEALELRFVPLSLCGECVGWWMRGRRRDDEDIFYMFALLSHSEGRRERRGGCVLVCGCGLS